MRISKLVLALSTLFLFSVNTHADLLLEPYLGYAIGSGEMGSSFEYDYKTPQIGARVGYQMLGVMAGVDYSMSTGKYDLDTTTVATGAETSTKYSKKQLGLFVGYNLPILLRVWGTYYLSASTEDDIAPITKSSGGGYALGAGFTGLPFVSLNLEYRTYSYDESETSGVTTALNPESDFNEIFLSVSLPLTF